MSNHHSISPHSGTSADTEELYRYAQSQLEKWKQQEHSKKKGTTK